MPSQAHVVNSLEPFFMPDEYLNKTLYTENGTLWAAVHRINHESIVTAKILGDAQLWAASLIVVFVVFFYSKVKAM